MKVIPIPTTKRFNINPVQQNPVHAIPKQGHDIVSFGDSERLVINGDYKNLQGLCKKSIHITGNAELGDAVADEDFVIGKTLNAKYISARTACLKGNATIEDKANVDDLVAMSKFNTRYLTTQKAYFIHGATITGNVKGETLTVANGDLTISGSSDFKRISSAGDNVELGDILKLDSIVLSNPKPNNIPQPEEIPTRVLKFNSSNIIPEQIQIVLDKFQKLEIHAPKDIWHKLVVCKFDDKAEGYIGEKLLPKALERLVKFV